MLCLIYTTRKLTNVTKKEGQLQKERIVFQPLFLGDKLALGEYPLTKYNWRTRGGVKWNRQMDLDHSEIVPGIMN